MVTLETLIEEGEKIISETGTIGYYEYITDEAKFYDWSLRAAMYLNKNFSNCNETEQFESLSKSKSLLKNNCQIMISILKAFKKNDLSNNFINDDFILTKIFDNFHKYANKHQDRYNNRKPFSIQDEYDVQDLLRAALFLFFDDIRKEEDVPSSCGKNSRIDFLLKKEKIGIEVKMTSDKLKDAEIGQQLNDDITKYETHPDCDSLYCFIYDPDNKLANPNGLINDLEKRSDKMHVRVFICPK